LTDEKKAIARDSAKYAGALATLKEKGYPKMSLRTFNKYHKAKANKARRKPSKLTTPDTPEVVCRDLETGKYYESANDITLGMTFAEYRLNRKGSATLRLIYSRKGGAR
jgi:hypothetical protein